MERRYYTGMVGRNGFGTRDICVQAPDKPQAVKLISDQLEPREGILLVGLSKVITSKSEVHGTPRRQWSREPAWEDTGMSPDMLVA